MQQRSKDVSCLFWIPNRSTERVKIAAIFLSVDWLKTAFSTPFHKNSYLSLKNTPNWGGNGVYVKSSSFEGKIGSYCLIHVTVRWFNAHLKPHRGQWSINIHETFQAKRVVCRRGHLKARQLAATELRKHIFQCRLNASSSDQTRVWSITQRTFEPVNVTRRLISSGAENRAWRLGINVTEGRMEGENVHLCTSTHQSICDTHTCRNWAKAQPCTIIRQWQWQIWSPFFILLIASPTKATLCKKINKTEKTPLKCRCASHKGLCVFVMLHCERPWVIDFLSPPEEHWHFHEPKMDTLQTREAFADCRPCI